MPIGMEKTKRVLLAGLALMLCAGPAQAQSLPSSDLVARGKQIAANNCARCHGIEREGPSPQKVAPPFRELDEAFPVDMLVGALKSGVVGGHDEMPMFDLGVADTRALVAYIDSLSTEGRRYLGAP